MKKALDYIFILLFSVTILLMKPVQASEKFNVSREVVPFACKLGVGLGVASGASYFCGTLIPNMVEKSLAKNPAQYQVNDQSLIDLIKQEAEKKSIDASKIIIVKGSEVGVHSWPGAGKIVFQVGPDEDPLSLLKIVDTDRRKAIVQHELCHIANNHLVKKFFVGNIAFYGVSLASYGTLSFLAKFAEEGVPSIASLVRSVRPVLSGLIGFYYAGKATAAYSKRCEKEADLLIDFNLIKPAIDNLNEQIQHTVNSLGQEQVKNNPAACFPEDHPTPYERIAYLEKKLQLAQPKR